MVLWSISMYIITSKKNWFPKITRKRCWSSSYHADCKASQIIAVYWFKRCFL